MPIPEGLTEEFHPSQPITPKQLLDWETKNKEPYPGYSEEFFNWENAWEEVNRAQQKADGGYLHLSDPVPVSPEFDETTGEPITYDEPHVVAVIRKAATPACTSTRLTCQPRKSPNPIQ